MTQQFNLMQMAEKVLDSAVSLGAQWCDVGMRTGRHIGVSLEKTAVKEADSGQGESASVRAFVNGAMGFAQCHGFDEDRLLNAARRAVGMACEGTPDPDFRGLPLPEEVSEVPGLFDERIAAMSVREVVDLAVANIRLARQLDPQVNLSGHVSMSAGEGVLVSSTGIRLHRRRTTLEGDMEAVVIGDDDEKGYYYEFDGGRVMEDCHIETIARAAIEAARKMLGARAMPSGRMSVVLGPLAAMDFVEQLVGAACAESIQRERSFLVGRRGQQIASDVLTVVDDPFVPRGLQSGEYDGEGAARRKITVFERGIFRTMLHNSYTAAKAGEPNNGRGSRSGGINPTNLQVSLGRRTEAELIGDIADGLYIPMSQFSPNSTTGDLSASVDFGFRIINGRIAYPIEGAMVAGNMLDLARSIDAISSDYRTEPGCLMPAMRLHDVQVSGSAD